MTKINENLPWSVLFAPENIRRHIMLQVNSVWLEQWSWKSHFLLLHYLFMFKCVFPLNTHFIVKTVFHHRLKNMSMTEKVRSSVCTDNIFIEHKNHRVFLCWSFRPVFFIIRKIIIGCVRKDETQGSWLNSYEASAFTLQLQWNVTTGGVIESVVHIQYIYMESYFKKHKRQHWDAKAILYIYRLFSGFLFQFFSYSCRSLRIVFAQTDWHL